ncbi:MAG: UDP-glucose 4-epimerase GalE [Oscillospiraceae bacterium]|nr:UDP-glucose 4-epimerase GalE [Oscillospiraceae bacterium]
MSVLLTGGAGYIGSHTAVELLNLDKEIVIVDNFSNSKMSSIENVKKITGKDVKVYNADIRDKEGIDKIFKENNVEEVIHFAGLKAVGESTEKPLEYYDNNVNGTICLLEVMKENNVKKIIFSSSATVYGISEKLPITENMKVSAFNVYGRTKEMIEYILKDLYESDKTWSVVLLRYFNPIGAHESGLIGENPNGIPNNLMPYINKVAAGKLECLSVFGNDYDTPDGTGIRDYIHVVDLALGHVKSLEKIKNTSGVFIYNLGTGVGYSVLDIINAFEKVNNLKINYKIVSRRPGDIAVCYADATKARTELGWVTTKTLEDMCKDSWRFEQNNN